MFQICMARFIIPFGNIHRKINNSKMLFITYDVLHFLNLGMFCGRKISQAREKIEKATLHGIHDGSSISRERIISHTFSPFLVDCAS